MVYKQHFSDSAIRVDDTSEADGEKRTNSGLGEFTRLILLDDKFDF